MGKEFRTHADDALYKSTPPLEALRLIVSRAATTDRARHFMRMYVGRTSARRIPKISLSNYQKKMKHTAKEMSWVS